MNPTHTAPSPSANGPHVLGSSLRRSSTDRLVLGVCGGIGRATGSNVAALRVATWALAVILLPVVVLAYLVTALILPRDDGATLIGAGPRDRRDVILAVIATFIAAPLVLDAADGSLLSTDPAPVIILGILSLAAAAFARRRAGGVVTPATFDATPASDERTGWADAPMARTASDPFSGRVTGPYADATETLVRDDDAASAAPASADSAITASTVTAPEAPEAPTFVRPGGLHPTPTGDEPTFVRPGGLTPTGEEPTFVRPGGSWTGLAGDDGDGTDGPGGPGDDGSSGSGPSGPGGDGPGGGHGPEHPTPHTPPPAPRRRGLALPVVSVLVLIPALFAVLVAVGAIDADHSAWAIMLALLAVGSAAGAVAIAILRPSYLGAGLLVVLAACFGASSIGVSQVGPVLDDGIGERAYRPSGTDELRAPYTLGLGELTIDLRDLDLAEGSRTRIEAKLGFGELRVVVPAGVRVVTAPGTQLASVTASARRTGATAAEAPRAPVIELDLDVRGGQVDLLTGDATRIENLERLASESAGFWGDDAMSAEELRREADRDRAETAADRRAEAEDRAAERRDAEADRALHGPGRILEPRTP